MVCPIMVDSIRSQIPPVIHKPFCHVRIGIQAIPDIPGFNLLVTAEPSIPSAKIGDNQNRLRHLNIQIDPLIVKVIAVEFMHQGISFILRQVRIFRFEVLPPVFVVQMNVPPYNMAVSVCFRFFTLLFDQIKVFISGRNRRSRKVKNRFKQES